MAREKIICIYEIRNISNNKVYIGQAIDFYKRWVGHKNKLKNKKHENPHLQMSWDKYGEDNFSHSVVEKCLVDELNDLETKWINFYDSRNPKKGYNLDSGGKKGHKISEETREKLSKARKGKTVSDETKNKISLALSGENNHNFGKKMTDYVKQKIKEGRIGKDITEETRSKMSEKRKGIKLSDETRKKMSLATSGEKNPMFGKKHSLETLEKLRSISTGKKHTQESKKKMSENKKGIKHTDETKQKIKDNRPDFNGEKHPRFCRKLENSASKYIGVTTYNSAINPWQTRINRNKKRIIIGYFPDEIVAAKAYDKYVVENNFTEYKLNFPEDYPNWNH